MSSSSTTDSDRSSEEGHGHDGPHTGETESLLTPAEGPVGHAGKPSGVAMAPATVPSYAYEHCVELDLMGLCTVTQDANGDVARAGRAHPEPCLAPVVNNADKSLAFYVQISPESMVHSSDGHKLYRLSHKPKKNWPRYVTDASSNAVIVKLRNKSRGIQVARGEKRTRHPWFMVEPSHSGNCRVVRFVEPSTRNVVATVIRHGDPAALRPDAIMLRVQPGSDAAVVLAISLLMLGAGKDQEHVPGSHNVILKHLGVQNAILPLGGIF